jgi:5-amino-6-(5-phosphoribosylamino)uracil reductase
MSEPPTLPQSPPQNPPQRPHTSVVLAMSADGKISDVSRSHPTFGSKHDYEFLERQVADADAVLGGAGTLRAGGSAMRVLNPDLIAQRVSAGKPEQPIQIVCSRSGEIDPTLRFFQQPVSRFLLTTPTGADRWQGHEGFDQVLVAQQSNHDTDWPQTLATLSGYAIERIAILGGGGIVAALLAADVIDELHLTVCPVLLGGEDSPSPVSGEGFLQANAPKLDLLHVTQIEHELFLHYRVRHRQDQAAHEGQ